MNEWRKIVGSLPSWMQINQAMSQAADKLLVMIPRSQDQISADSEHP